MVRTARRTETSRFSFFDDEGRPSVRRSRESASSAVWHPACSLACRAEKRHQVVVQGSCEDNDLVVENLPPAVHPLLRALLRADGGVRGYET